MVSKAKRLFFANMYKVYFNRYYIEIYRSKILKRKRAIACSIATAPVVFIAVIGMRPAMLQSCLAFAGLFSIIEAVTRFLPYDTRQEELLKCSIKIDCIISEMELMWRKYKIDCLPEEEFLSRTDVLFLQNCAQTAKILCDSYKEKSSYREFASKQAVDKLKDMTDFSAEELLREFRETESPSSSSTH